MRPLLLVLPVVLAAACTVGDGTGEAKGEIDAPECGLSGAFDLEPDYFGAERFGDDLTITMQHGGDYVGKSDGILFDLRDVPEVQSQLGQPLPVRYDPDATLTDLEQFVRAAVYLNESCDLNEHMGLVATSGTLTMTEIGGGKVGEGDRLAGSFTLDLSEPAAIDGGASGSLTGNFRFRYTRGRPAQRFP